MAGPGLGSKNKQKLGSNGSPLLKGAGTKQPAKRLGGSKSHDQQGPIYQMNPYQDHYSVTIKAKGNPAISGNSYFGALYIAQARNQERLGEASPYRKHFQAGGRDAVATISAPLIAIFVAEGGLIATAVEFKGAVSFLTPVARSMWTFMQKRIISGFNSKLAASKLALSITSQYVGAKAINQDFGLNNIDWADVMADQYMHPLAGASFSAGVNVTSEGVSVNSFQSFLIGTVTGYASNLTEGFLDSVAIKQLDKYSSNLANYVLQVYQKSVTSGMTSIIQWDIEGRKQANAMKNNRK